MKYTLKIEIEVQSELKVNELHQFCESILKDRIKSIHTDSLIKFDVDSLYIPVIDNHDE